MKLEDTMAGHQRLGDSEGVIEYHKVSLCAGGQSPFVALDSKGAGGVQCRYSDGFHQWDANKLHRVLDASDHGGRAARQRLSVCRSFFVPASVGPGRRSQ